MEQQLIDLLTSLKYAYIKIDNEVDIELVYEMFKNDLFKYYGVENNPKKDLLFSKAWEFGHSSGYNEVAIYFGDLVELIRR